MMRKATRLENSRDCNQRKYNVSGIGGVYWHAPTQKWCAQISINARRKHLGLFSNKAEAGLAVDIARIVHHGEFARLNDPTGRWLAMFNATPQDMRPSPGPCAVDTDAPSSAGDVGPATRRRLPATRCEATMSLFAAIEAQPILVDRIECYRTRHRIATLGEAIERLTRAGLFIDALPDGSTLIRREGRAEWREPDRNNRHEAEAQLQSDDLLF
jgi:hypothetical protein